MELMARLTQDAAVATLSDGRKVVNFSVAHNDYYKPKDAGEVKKITQYYRCAYWLGAGVAEHLTKGTLVELSGRVGLDVYTSATGEARGNLTFHVNSIKLHGKAAKGGNNVAAEPAGNAVADDDLPF